jgi:glycosyltransferase involved in cell wall biosynthesis
MKLSIVTPSFNQCAYLRQTMASVLSQQQGGAGGEFELEHLVIDGGSTDGTIDLLRSTAEPRIRWVSETDRGQAHAINKGLSLANGEVVAWLNSDDLYVDGALAAVAAVFASRPEARWLVGRCEIIDGGGRTIRRAVTRYKDSSLRRYSRRALLRENFISQPAVFWRRAFADQLAGSRPLLDESLHFAMDYDLWLRMGELAEPVLLDRVLARFRLHPASKSGGVNREQFDEQYRVADRYLGDDRVSRLAHRFNVAKIVWSYRVMRLIGL